MQKITRQTMIDYAKQEVARGSIYVWGAQGERGDQITESWIRAKETSTDYANRAIETWNKSKATHDPAQIGAFDCSGLIGACLNANGNPGYDTTADGYMSLCNRISQGELQPGDLCFKLNKNGTANHVGVFVGNGHVVEARGRDYGVVETALDARGWQRFGRPDFMYVDGVQPTPAPQPEKEIPALTRNLKLTDPMMRGDDVRKAQERLEHHLAQPGKIDGVYGKKTKAAVIRFQKARIAEGYDLGTSGADGVIGPKTWKILW